MGSDFSKAEVSLVGQVAYLQGRSDEGCKAGDQMRRLCGIGPNGGGGPNHL